MDKLGHSGRFNITTVDFLRSHSCDERVTPDLIWGHTGRFTCNADIAGRATFVRETLWLKPLSLGGLLFGKVLCPKATLKRGNRTEISLKNLQHLCSSVSFNNCAVFY